MNAKPIILTVLLSCLFSLTAFSQTRSVSQQDALTIAQRQFQGQDVDYFILQDNNPTEWKIHRLSFVCRDAPWCIRNQQKDFPIKRMHHGASLQENDIESD